MQSVTTCINTVINISLFCIYNCDCEVHYRFYVLRVFGGYLVSFVFDVSVFCKPLKNI